MRCGGGGADHFSLFGFDDFQDWKDIKVIVGQLEMYQGELKIVRKTKFQTEDAMTVGWLG